ncbi:ARM repeat-containing protein [Basidiobolus meristosporus CBS 931.73]|uniref:ARM repeat-containing protein n=1 Tax=Basidiobolus meristosporus CBS 931.73 TaxID=1314790 RepID=A0A1Y1YUI5_9FUNG|nr:ARM repeat-containing protein [Basidiobolus meristosporus CBS 931.73]|eukprot:ORY01225.1 ARM repeat-containing protein [Basidiobolus meristosporus CBS 931.73]
MGKVHRKKASRQRPNPTGIPSVADVNKEESQLQGGVRPEDVLPVIQKLSAPEASDRAWAAAGVSNLLLSDPKTRRLLMSKNLVGLLIDRLTDDNIDVLVEAAGALRNLASIGGDEVCGEMFNKNILSPIQGLVPKVSQIINDILGNVPASTEEEKEKRKSIWDFSDNIICIIWSLSETSEKIFNSINKANFLPFLMSFISASDKLPLKPVLSAAQALNALTDDNKEAFKFFSHHHEYISLLGKMVTTPPTEDRIQLSVLAAGILINLRPMIADPTDDSTDIIKAIGPLLINCLQYDTQSAAKEAVDLAGVIKTREQAQDFNQLSKDQSTEEERLAAIDQRIVSLQFCLELLANLSAEDIPEEEQWEDANGDNEDDDDAMSDSSVVDIPADIVMDEHNNEAQAFQESDNSLFSAALPYLIPLGTPTPISFPPQVSGEQPISPSTTNALSVLHLRALSCLNNFLITMSESTGRGWFKQHQQDVDRCWNWLFEVANTTAGSGLAVGQGQESRASVMEAVVGCLWTLARGAEAAVPVSEAQIAALIQSYHTTAVDSMRVKTIGLLGVLAQRKPGYVEANKVIGTFMISLIQEIPKTSVEVLVEVLNAIYDIYGDIAYDYDRPVFVEGNFLNVLKQSTGEFRKMVKVVDRRKQKLLRQRADEAYLNLNAFIKYKESEL